MNSELVLHFSKTLSGIALERTEFFYAPTAQRLVCVRGGCLPQMQGESTFSWSAGVRAAALLVAKHSLAGETIARLRGDIGSAAASLDYAISKEPNWALDMFGTSPGGKALIKRLFCRRN